MPHFKKLLAFILCAAMVFILIPARSVFALTPPRITLGSARLADDDTYYYPAASVNESSLGDIRTILVSFADSVTAGDRIILPATPSGFLVSASSADNDYTKRVNLDEGVSIDAVQTYIRSIHFAIASKTQTVQITLTTESITHDTFYNIDTEHYYQYIPDTSSDWITAYNSAQGMTYMGRTGYLATVMNKNEDIYLNSLSGGKTGWLGGTILSNTGTAEGSLYYDGFNVNAVVSTGWYWACGPEKGTTFYNANSLYPNGATSSNAAAVDANNTTYYNWARGTVSYEPNNQTAYVSSDNQNYETCLTTLIIAGNTGKAGTDFSWNDKHYDSAGEGEWDAKGYFVEYGNLPVGDSNAISGTTGSTGSYAWDSSLLHQPSGDISLTTVAWTSATAYTCGIDLPAASEMVTISVDSGYFTVPSLGGALTYLGGTNGTDYISSYGSGTHFGSAVFSFTDASAAETPLSGIAYTPDGTASQTITATSSTVSPLSGDIYFEGHYYRYVDSGTASIDWPTSVLHAAATDDPYFGGRGYIATATSQAENSILLRLVENGALGDDHWDDAWMGGLWQRNTGTSASPTIVRGTDGNELTYSDLRDADASGLAALLKDYTMDFSFGFDGDDSSTFICNNPDAILYYWIDGPEAGQEIANNTDAFAPWHSGEPNCGDFVYIGWQGAYWDDLSAYSDDSGSAFNKLNGYIVEFSGFDGGTTEGIVKSASKTTSAHAATVNVYVDGVAADAPGTVDLRQSGSTVATAAASATGVYTTAVPNGTYDVFVNNEDTGTDLTISGGSGSAALNYYTVSFSVADAGKASGSTISATADGLSIASGTTVPANKAVVITALEAGAPYYFYKWSGSGTNGETTSVLNIAALSGPVNAVCTVTGYVEQETPPVVTTSPTTVRTQDGIQLVGEVVSTGSAPVTERGFVFGTASNPTIASADAKMFPAGAGTGTFTATPAGLLPGVTYYARSYAISADGVFYGDVIEITLQQQANVPQTGAPSSDAWIVPSCFGFCGLLTALYMGRRKHAAKH